MTDRICHDRIVLKFRTRYDLSAKTTNELVRKVVTDIMKLGWEPERAAGCEIESARYVDPLYKLTLVRFDPNRREPPEVDLEKIRSILFEHKININDGFGLHYVGAFRIA